MTTILLALGLVCVVEGLIWALMPRLLRRMAEELPKIDDQTLRIIGELLSRNDLGVRLTEPGLHGGRHAIR